MNVATAAPLPAAAMMRADAMRVLVLLGQRSQGSRRVQRASTISDAFATFLSRTPARGASGACSVAMIDLHSAQTMSAASCSYRWF
jgi:hypothetical protein